MLRRLTTIVVAIILSACATALPDPARAAFETRATAAYLYDLTTDPYEMTNLVDAEASKGKLDDMRAALIAGILT